MVKAKYSKTTNGIYPTDVYTEFPDDAVDMSDHVYKKYQAGEYNGLDLVDGKVVGTKFKPLELSAEELRESIVVTAFQARAALARSGKLESVAAIMANENTPLETKLAWEYAQTFKRLSPTILQLQPVLGLSDQDLDDLFALAATIDA